MAYLQITRVLLSLEQLYPPDPIPLDRTGACSAATNEFGILVRSAGVTRDGRWVEKLAQLPAAMLQPPPSSGSIALMPLILSLANTPWWSGRASVALWAVVSPRQAWPVLDL